MKRIPLTQGKFALVDDEWFSYLSQFKWNFGGRGCAQTNRKRGSGMISMHRMIMNPPSGLAVDHINRNKLDNRISNLRICTIGENSRNRAMSRNNRIGLKGVRRTLSGKFMANITCNKIRFYLGSFEIAQHAHEAYCKAALKLHGEFARFS